MNESHKTKRRYFPVNHCIHYSNLPQTTLDHRLTELRRIGQEETPSMNADRTYITILWNSPALLQMPNPVTIGNIGARCSRPPPESHEATRAFSVNNVKYAVMASDPVQPVYGMDKNAFDALDQNPFLRRLFERKAEMLGFIA